MESTRVMQGLMETNALWVPTADAIPELRQASAELTDLGQSLLAGYVLVQAIHAAWGDPDLMRTVAQEGFAILLQVADDPTTTQLAAVAALKVLSQQVSLFSAPLDLPESEVSYAIVRNELGERIAGLGRASAILSDRAGFLVRGFRLRVDFDGSCSASFPETDVLGTTTTSGPDHLQLDIESAFRIAINSGDYFEANDLAALAPEAFTTPSLVGWKLAVTGFLNQADAADAFAAAADAFARDVLDPTRESWSSINVDLWAKNFRARSAVAEIARDPSVIRAKVEEALDALQGTDSGWFNPQVTCFRILLQAVLRVLSENDAPSLDDLVAQVHQLGWVGGDDGVSMLAEEFLALTQDGLREVSDAPERAFVSGTLTKAVGVLGRLPLFEDEVRSHVGEAVGKRALSRVLDRQQTWIHKTLESIGDERDLHVIVLRILQAGHPHYAQIRHGPQEYGKDVVALVEGEHGADLEMYQAKVGDISLPRWREVKPKLEEMFEVDVKPLQLPVSPSNRRGILVFNGHILPQAEPAASGWALDQKARGREYEFMHLDSIVRWIVTQRLTGEFRAALNERGIVLEGSL